MLLALALTVTQTMTPALIQEAIDSGAPPCYEMTAGAVLVGCFSTPFSRVSTEARQAKARYAKYAPADASTEALAPEVVVMAAHQGRSRVVAVVIAPKGSADDAAVILPTRTEPGRSALYAAFPISALSEANEVRIVYDGAACIARAGRNECVVPFALERVR